MILREFGSAPYAVSMCLQLKQKGTVGRTVMYYIENDQIDEQRMCSFLQKFKLFNETFTGPIRSGPIRILARKPNGEIAGGLTGGFAWEWLNIDYWWIHPSLRGNGLGKELLLRTQNRALAEGVTRGSLYTVFEYVRDMLKKHGYENDGILQERPPGFDTFFMKNENLDVSGETGFSNFTFDDEPSQQDVSELIEQIESEQKKALGEYPFKPLSILAIDDTGELIGGITGYIGWNWLYISVLWVDESYRGGGIGRILLRKLESMAVSRNVTNAFMGTTVFQAKGFYERQGYRVFSVRDNLPPGYRNFSMRKSLHRNTH